MSYRAGTRQIQQVHRLLHQLRKWLGTRRLGCSGGRLAELWHCHRCGHYLLHRNVACSEMVRCVFSIWSLSSHRRRAWNINYLYQRTKSNTFQCRKGSYDLAPSLGGKATCLIKTKPYSDFLLLPHISIERHVSEPHSSHEDMNTYESREVKCGLHVT